MKEEAETGFSKVSFRVLLPLSSPFFFFFPASRRRLLLLPLPAERELATFFVVRERNRTRSWRPSRSFFPFFRPSGSFPLLSWDDRRPLFPRVFPASFFFFFPPRKSSWSSVLRGCVLTSFFFRLVSITNKGLSNSMFPFFFFSSTRERLSSHVMGKRGLSFPQKRSRFFQTFSLPRANKPFSSLLKRTPPPRFLFPSSPGGLGPFISGERRAGRSPPLSSVLLADTGCLLPERKQGLLLFALIAPLTV